jgi:hypothetical protein
MSHQRMILILESHDSESSQNFATSAGSSPSGSGCSAGTQISSSADTSGRDGFEDQEIDHSVQSE